MIMMMPTMGSVMMRTLGMIIDIFDVAMDDIVVRRKI